MSPLRHDDLYRPRYCVCPAYHRDPTLPEQCTICWRRIHPDLDDEIRNTETKEHINHD